MRFLMIFFGLALLPLTAQAQNLATLKPLHSLLSNVIGEGEEAELLLKGAQSPHDFQLKPSDARKLAEAKAVFWIGPEMETFLNAPLKNIASKATLVTLSKSKGLQLIESDPHDHHDHAAEEKHAHDDEHDHKHVHKDKHDHEEDHNSAYDMHLWLDIDNAKVMVQEMAHALSQLNPENAAIYTQNSQHTLDRLTSLDQELKTMLAPHKDKAFVAYHNAYGYFSKRYTLKQTDVVLSSQHKEIGAKRLGELIKSVKEHEVVCLFGETQFSDRLIKTLARETGAKTATLDPLGSPIDAGPEQYFQMMKKLGETFKSCLS